ncbi:hypothetical protein LSAT2_010626, partial [Lamellibrachia satsuma]
TTTVTAGTTVATTTGVDACASQPCQNGGTCTKDDDGYKCTCPVCGCSQGANTLTCDLADDMCVNEASYTSHPYNCHEYVQCANSRVAQTLPCQPAENVFDPAKGSCSPLLNVTCAQQPKTTTVTAGTTVATTTETTTVTAGTTVATTTGVDACASQPCQNGGTCTKDDDGYKCTCPVCGCSQGANTLTCDLADDMCVNQASYTSHPYNCHEYVQCANSRVAQTLPCQPAENVFDPVKGSCSPLLNVTCAQQPKTTTVTAGTTVATTTGVDACASQPCQNGGTCTKDYDGYKCTCPVCGCSQGRNTLTCGLADEVCANQASYTSHPYNCHKYVQCANSRVAQTLPCQPAENVFDPANGSCAPLFNVTCAQPSA